MKIVKISDLSEEERKKALEEQEQRYQENEANRKAELKRVADLNTELRIQEKMDKVYNSAPIAENGYTSNKQENKNIWNDLKGVASNFTRSLGNLGINAYENVNRINGEYINQRNKLLEDTNNKYLTKSLESKGYTEQQSQKIMNNTPTLESIANNSKVLNSITNNANKIIQPMEKNFQEWENANNQKIQENIENASNPLSKKILELTPSIAQSSVNLIPGGNVLFSAGITQNYYEDAKQQKGMSDEEASRYAAIMATLESATEIIGAGLTKNVGKALIKGNVKSALVNYGLDIGENFLEEAVMEPLNELTTTAVAGKEKANWENIGQRSLQAGIDGAITSVLMGGASAGVGSAVNVVNKISNGQTVAQSEIQTAVKDTQNSGIVDVESILKDEMNNAINKSNLQQNQTNNSNILPTAQTIQEQNKMSQNQTSEQTNNIPIDKYNISAKKYNIDIKNETVQSIKKVTEQRGINTTYNAEMFKDSTTNAIWKTTTDTNGNTIREVILNPKADTNKTLQNVIVHELTHDFEGTKEYTQLADTIMKNVVTKTDYETARKSLEETYSNVYDKNSVEFKNLVDQEAVADVLGNKLGNQEFVSNLTMEQPSVAKKIYNWVIDKLNKITGYSNEKIFWADVKNKFENAYRQDYQGNNNKSRYSIQTDNNGNKYVKVDTDQDIFNGIAEKDYNKIAKMYMQDYLKGKTNLSENDSVSVGNKGISKYTNPKQTTRYMTEKMKLSTELKNALEIAQKDSISAPTKDTSKYPKWEYYKFNFELGGKNFEGTINIGIDKDGNKHFYEINKIHTTSNSHVSASKSSSTDSINNSIAPIKNDVNTTAKYSMQESENNSGSFSFDKNVKRYEDLEIANIVKFNKKSDGTINIEISDNSKLINQFTVYSKENASKQLGNNIANYIYDNATENSKIINLKQVENVEVQDRTNKQKQLEIIKKTNPMMDGYHIGIRSIDDIKTFDEVIDNEVESFAWGDFTKKDAENALKKGKITIYSSYPIKQGTFVSTSKIQAEEYAGGIGKKVYSKTVSLEEVAWINGDEGQYANTNQRYSQNNENWQKFLNQNYKSEGTGQTIKDVKLPTAQKQVAPTAENNVLPKAKRKLNPTEIANLTMNDANTTPILPQKNYTKGNKQSSFFRNVIEDAQFLNKDLRQEMSQDENIRYYKGITNAETLEKAYTELQKGGQEETLKWFNKESKDISPEDVVKGWILLKQYQDKGDHQGAVEVAKKMRNMGTKAGQAVQAYNILSRLTPEGMFYYAQSELSEAYNKMAEGKSKEWIDDNKSKFDLTPEETQIIKEKMESIQGVEDERTKKIALAEIQKIITNKIPPTASQSIKSWMRISMLFNPKTQVRNIAGNAVILPVNMTSDFIASGVDKIISKKTGVRTTGNTNLKNYAKGFGKGLYESYDDFRKGINTRNIEGNRFEVTEGKNFKDKGIGKALNRVDNMLSFMLDAGDRGFYEATFTNSINNQLVLNNTTKVTPDMIDIATQEALQRTWQDNNTYTNAVLKIRKLLNFNKGYGLGDVLIPFAKTPANLTKAIVDYSPVGLTKTLAVDARKLNNSLQNGQYTPQLQHKFVQDLGKGMAGSLLYILGYALAKAGVITGEADDDKDVKNFMKNSLGINSYSIKIGDKSFAYDWAQPVATPFAIMANFEKYNRENPDASVIDKAINSINIGSEQLLQQSFMESINTILNGNGTALENISQAILELPSRAVPTLSKQVADMIDGTQRTSFEYGKPVESAVNSVVAKIPGLSKTLAPSVDTLGNEIQKYGGDNGVWNVMFNPANMNKGKLSKAGEEIYNVYMETGDATLLPRTAPYYVDSKGEKKTMTSMQRSEFQKITGKYVENTINGLLNNKDYKKLSNDKKAELINEIVSDSYSKAKYDVLKIDSEQYEKLRNTLKSASTTSYYDYKSKTEEAKKDNEKLEVLVDANYTEKEKQTLYENYIKSKTDEKYDIIKTVNNFNIESYLEYKLASSNGEFKADKKDDGTVSGKTISGSAKNKKFDYISNMKNTPYMQKAILFGLENTPNKSDKTTIVNYISSLPGKTNKEKLDMLDQFSWITIYKNGTIKY